MKKWFVSFLLLITITGTFIPCCQEDDCCIEQVSSTNQSENEEGTCSPFFSCATCPGFVELARSVQWILPGSFIQLYHETCIQLNLSTYSSTCWQPPRDTRFLIG